MPRRVKRTEQIVDEEARDTPGRARVAELVAGGDAHGDLIGLLQRAQSEFGCLSEPIVDEIARRTGVPPSRIHGIVTFYARFSTVPSGRHKVLVCHGTACHVAGATRVTEAFEQELGVADGQTTADMEFELGSVACMGACSQAPVMRIDDRTYGDLSADKTRKALRGLLKELGLAGRYPRPKGAAADGGVGDG